MPDKVRVVRRPDGGVSVIYPAPNSKRQNETETAWFNRVFTKAMSGDLKGRPYDDVLKATLPPNRVDRDFWEWDNVTKRIKVNQGQADQARAATEREEKIAKGALDMAEEWLIGKGEL